MFDYLANPARFMRIADRLFWPLVVIATALIGTGLYYGLLNSPPDYQQGETVRIMYVHVPAAWIATLGYVALGLCGLFYIVWRHPLADVALRAMAPAGAMFAFLTLVTGAFWGKPMWGTPWVWDPRLTSFAIMLIFYISYITLWNAIENRDKASDLTSILCLVGSIFAVLSRYAVNFWDKGLHQGASLSLDKEEHVSNEFFFPLVICMTGFMCLFVTLVLVRTQTEIRKQRIISLLKQKVYKND